MFPSPALDYAVDTFPAHAELSRQFAHANAARRVPDADRSHGVIGQLGGAVFLPGSIGAVPAAVVLIFSWRAPHEVFETVIHRVAVQVSALHVLRRDADEHFKDQPMNDIRFVLRSALRPETGRVT